MRSVFVSFCLVVFLTVFFSCDEFKGRAKTMSHGDTIKSHIKQAMDEVNSPEERKRNAAIAQALLDEVKMRDSLDVISDRTGEYITMPVNDFYIFLSVAYHNIPDWEGHKRLVDKMLELAQAKEDTLFKAKAYVIRGEYYYNVTEMDSAFYDFYEAKKLYTGKNKTFEAADVLTKMAVVQYEKRDFMGAENTAYKALSLNRPEDDKEPEYAAYNVIGLCKKEFKDYEGALEAYGNALAIVNRFEGEDQWGGEQKAMINNNNRGVVYNNMGLVYEAMEDYDKAIDYFLRAVRIEGFEHFHKKVYTYALNNLGRCYMRKGDFRQLPGLFFQSMAISKEQGNVSGEIYAQISLSEYHEIKQHRDSSLYYAHQAYDLALKINSLGHQIRALKRLREADTENETKYSRKYITVSEILQTEERKNSERFARIEFETDELIMEKEQLIKERRNVSTVSLIVLFVVFLLYVIRTQAGRNQKIQFLQAQQETNEAVYEMMLSHEKRLHEAREWEKKKIGRDLHDGVLSKLFGVRMALDLFLKDDEEAIAKGKKDRDFVKALKNVEQQIREISHDLSAEKKRLGGNFVHVVHSMLEDQRMILSETEIHSEFDLNVEWDKVDNEVKINFYRVLQEAFQNINKYASPENVWVKLEKEEDRIILEIKDDGEGFELDSKKKGIGLSNMHIRMKSVKGDLTIQSSPGMGTVILASVSVKDQKEVKEKIKTNIK